MAMTLRTDEELTNALKELSEAEGVSQQEVIRRAVLDRYVRTGHRARVDRAGIALAERWSTVLDRLATS